MSKWLGSFINRLGMLTALAMHSVLVNAAADAIEDGARGLELICLTEQPAIVEGDSVTLKAWVTTSDGRSPGVPTKFKWKVDAGRVEAQTAVTRWDLSIVKAPRSGARKVTASARAIPAAGSELRCSVEVWIGSIKDAPRFKTAAAPAAAPAAEAAPPAAAKAAPRAARATERGDTLLSAKRFLLPGDVEEFGYGLYSYLILSAPPNNDEEKARYLKTIEAYLHVLQDVDDYLRRHVRPQSLNVTYIPLKRAPVSGNSNAEWATNVLAAYDYAAAQIFLNRVGRAPLQGPYLVSVLKPLSQPGEPAYLCEDLTGVAPELAWNWVTFFAYLAAQQRSWSEVALQRFGLTLRNLIAVGSKVTPDVMKGIEKAFEFKPKA